MDGLKSTNAQRIIKRTWLSDPSRMFDLRLGHERAGCERTREAAALFPTAYLLLARFVKAEKDNSSNQVSAITTNLQGGELPTPRRTQMIKLALRHWRSSARSQLRFHFALITPASACGDCEMRDGMGSAACEGAQTLPP